MVLFCKDIANNVAVLQRNVIFLKNSFLGKKNNLTILKYMVIIKI